MTVWYRYTERGHVRLDGPRDLPSYQYPVVRETPCGVWLQDGFRRRWVSKTARKRFAYPTREEARESYRIRKRRHVEHLETQLRRARELLKQAETFLETGRYEPTSSALDRLALYED